MLGEFSWNVFSLGVARHQTKHVQIGKNRANKHFTLGLSHTLRFPLGQGISERNCFGIFCRERYFFRELCFFSLGIFFGFS